MWEALGTILAPIFAALLKGFLDYKHEQDDDASRERLGEASTAAAVNKESADAARRMAQSNANSHTRADVLARLQDGSA